MILRDPINVLVIVGCSVWCIFLGCMVFGFLLGSMVMYLWMSQSNSISKLWGGGWRDFASWLGWYKPKLRTYI